MTNFESKRLASDDGPNSGGPTEHPGWRKIREWSVSEFVDRVAKYLGALENKVLRAALYDMAVSDGATTFRHQGISWTGDMVLDAWRKSFDSAGFEPFPNRREWDEFCDAMRKLRDPSVPMYGDRRALLKIGATIEARQLPHARARGWA